MKSNAIRAIITLGPTGGYVTRLMFHIPDATVRTLRELLEPGGASAFREHIDQLSGTVRRFFETGFDGAEFANTRH